MVNRVQRVSSENQMDDGDAHFDPASFDLSQLFGMLFGQANGPVNWDAARQVASQLSLHDPDDGTPRDDPPVDDTRAEYLAAVVRAAQTNVAGVTGLAEAAAVPIRCVTRLGWTAVTLDGLRPQNLGGWQGLTLDEWRRKFPKVAKQLQEDPTSVCPPNGEMLAAALERVVKSLRPVLRKHAKETVLLIVPEPLRLAVAAQVRGLPPAAPWPDDDAPRPAWEALDLSPARGKAAP